MAHADYHCCAICDCKMGYAAFDALTKEEICTSCLKELRDAGIHIITPSEFVEWAKKQRKEKLSLVLKAIRYGECCYRNDFDEQIQKLLD